MNAAAPTRRMGGPGRRGFSMVELSMSLLVTSVLVVAIGSSIVLASHAIPDPGESTARTITASGALDRLVQELHYAIAINEQTDRTIEFRTADRDADAVDETIRYEWSGDAGDPLLRSYNGGPAVAVAYDVMAFKLNYAIETYKRRDPPVRSAELMLSERLSAVSRSSLSINSTVGIGQYFFPSALPAQAISWTITRVQVMASQNGSAGGMTYAELRPAEVGHLPGGTIVQQVSVAEADLSTSANWYDIVFTGVPDLSPDDGLCLVLRWVSDADSARIDYDGAGGTDRLATNDGGSTWTVQSASSMLYAVMGTYAVQGPEVIVDILARVDARLECGGEAPAAVHASVETVNRPEVAP